MSTNVISEASPTRVESPDKREAGAVSQALVAELAGITDEKSFRERSPRAAFDALPKPVQNYFYGPRMFVGEAIGLGRSSNDGQIFLYPYWGNLGGEAAHVLGVARGADGRLTPIQGVIEKKWFGATGRLKLEVAGPSMGPHEAGTLIQKLETLRRALPKEPVVPWATPEVQVEKATGWSTDGQ